MKVLLFGSKGFMGRRFLEIFPEAIIPSVDIADGRNVGELLDCEKPDLVINAAGRTGRPNVDWCETHRMETLKSNVTGPLVLLEELGRRGIYWVHLSSGCIYQGDNNGKGFVEDDPPNYVGSFYSRTKAWSDQILKDFPNVLILRLRMPFDDSTDDRNLIMKLRKYPRVLDAQNSLTSIPDFLIAAKALIERRKTGVYNMVNPGTISPFEIMELHREIMDPNHRFEKLTLAQLGGVVKAGRSNCVLSCEKLKREGLEMPTVRESVASSLEKMIAPFGVAQDA
ncbi:sugar nucleotide-binding protein [Candidatus Peregrinibacteria bacterium]|nr:sugar nucleotide-binding protein [Candidatus Peregrinibacteria bacterium]MBI3816690.1 sugar nucleotide-binding protein [Candidatus Peregrinibacteria bacterium]